MKQLEQVPGGVDTGDETIRVKGGEPRRLLAHAVQVCLIISSFHHFIINGFNMKRAVEGL